MTGPTRGAGEGIGELLSPRVAVALEEYRALREEVVSSLGMQQTTLSFSTLALGGLALAGLREFGHKGNLGELIFLLVLPFFSYISLFIWLGEYARTTRAGCFLKSLEQRINSWVGGGTLTWEQYLRTPVRGRVPQYAWNVWAIFCFYAAIPGMGVVVVGLAGSLDAASLLAVSVLELGAWLLIVGKLLLNEFYEALDAAAGSASEPNAPRAWGVLRAALS